MADPSTPALKLIHGAVPLNPYNARVSPIYSATAHSNGPANIVMTAGQIGARADGSVPADRVEEIQQAVQNLRRCLEAAGARAQDILKLTYYIVDHDHENPLQRAPLLEYLGECRPPATLVPVHKLARPEYHFEVEATAAIPQFPNEKVDVVIVGAGLSGLQAAVDLQKAGLSVKVLEARDRIGGKTWSRSVGSANCDVGAAWINDTNQSRMFALAQRFGLSLVLQNTTGSFVCGEGLGAHKLHPYGEYVSDDTDKAAIDDMLRMIQLVEATCQQIDIHNPVASGRNVLEDLDNITFEQWIRSHNPGESGGNALRIGARAMLGVEASEMSALYFLNYCKSGGGYAQMRSDRKNGGQYLRIAEGTQAFSRGLARELKPDSVLLMSPVRVIEQRDDGLVRVTSARGVYEAKKVVISIPTPLYKEIQFDPPLPADKLKLSSTSLLGDYCKAIVLYGRPWWRESDLCGLALTINGPWSVTRDSSVDDRNHYSLTCFVVGQPARDWKTLSAVDRKAAVLSQIERIFGRFSKPETPVDYVEQIWKSEQWSQGCPCPVLGPGGLTQFEQTLRSTVENLHFVGTETAFEWKGYMEGAVRSGERGAQEVLASFSNTLVTQ